MSEEKNTPPASLHQADLAITASVQYIKDFSVENPHAPFIFSKVTKPPSVDLGINISTRGVADNTYEVVLSVRLEAKVEGEMALLAELAYAGVFVVPPLDHEELLKQALLVEAPRFLFPFARAIIGQAARDAGFPQLLLQPVDFQALFEANRDKITAGKGVPSFDNKDAPKTDSAQV